MATSTSTNLSALSCLSDLIRELEGNSHSFAANSAASHGKPSVRKAKARSSSSSSDDSFHDSGFASEQSDSSSSFTKDPANPPLSKRSLELLQRFLDYYLEEEISRDDPPVVLSNGRDHDKFLSVERFVNALNIPQANVWTIGSHFALRLLATISSKRSEQCFALEPLVQQSIKLYLTVLSGVATNSALSNHLLREVAQRKTVGVPEIDLPIRKARNLLADYHDSSPPPSSPASSTSDLSLAPLPHKYAKSRPRNLSLSISTLSTRSYDLSFNPTHARSRTTSISISKPTPVPPAIINAIDDRSSLASFSPTMSAETSLRKLRDPAKHRVANPPSTGNSWNTTAKEALKTIWARGHRRRVPSISLSPCPSLSNPSVKVKEDRSPQSPDSIAHLFPPLSRPSAARRMTVPVDNKSPNPSTIASQTSSTDLAAVKKSGNSKMDPTLAAVERASRLRARVICDVCDKAGSDYPRCPRCQIAWCSRQCRMSGNGGKKHLCRS